MSQCVGPSEICWTLVESQPSTKGASEYRRRRARTVADACLFLPLLHPRRHIRYSRSPSLVPPTSPPPSFPLRQTFPPRTTFAPQKWSSTTTSSRRTTSTRTGRGGSRPGCVSVERERTSCGLDGGTRSYGQISDSQQFDQPGKKKSRRVARSKKALTSGAAPLQRLRPAVRCPTQRYNIRIRGAY